MSTTYLTECWIPCIQNTNALSPIKSWNPNPISNSRPWRGKGQKKVSYLWINIWSPFLFFLILFLELLNLHYNAIQELRLKIFLISKSILVINMSIMLLQFKNIVIVEIQKSEYTQVGKGMLHSWRKRQNIKLFGWPSNIWSEFLNKKCKLFGICQSIYVLSYQSHDLICVNFHLQNNLCLSCCLVIFLFSVVKLRVFFFLKD